MFFKAIFALYFTAVALAAPKGAVLGVGDVGKLRVDPVLYPGLSNLDVDGNDIIEDIANVDVADVIWRHDPS